MKVFKNIMAFWELYIDALSIKHGCYWQRVIDEYNIRVLQNYRIAAAFAVPILITVENVDKNLQACIRRIIDECEEVLKDESLYIVAGKRNPKLSQKLGDAVEKASDAVAHAGNLCNNLIPYLENQIPANLFALGLRARDICDRAIKIRHF
jgi:hypothetical protein